MREALRDLEEEGVLAVWRHREWQGALAVRLLPRGRVLRNERAPRWASP